MAMAGTYAYQPVVANHAACRPHLLQGWPGRHRTSSRPASSARRAAPTTRRTLYLNNGFIIEEQRHGRSERSVEGHDSVPPAIRHADRADDAPGARSELRALRAGQLEADAAPDGEPRPPRSTGCSRYDKIFDVVRENAHIVQPRLGFSYLVTKNAKNVLRGSYVRLGEQMMGRDAVTTFGATGAVGRSSIPTTSTATGSFETSIPTPARTGASGGVRVRSRPAPAVRRRVHPRLPACSCRTRSASTSRASIAVYKDMYARIDINGFYPSGPNQPFGGFGKVDPNRGIVFQQTNNSWSQLNYTRARGDRRPRTCRTASSSWPASTGSGSTSSGDWNPTDPARFIQPDAFANDKLLYMPRGQQRGEQPADHDRHDGAHLRPDVAEVPAEFRRLVYCAVRHDAGAAATPSRPGRGLARSSISCRWAIRSSRYSVQAIVSSSTGVAPEQPARRRACGSCTRPAATARCMAPASETLGLKIGKKIKF